MDLIFHVIIIVVVTVACSKALSTKGLKTRVRNQNEEWLEERSGSRLRAAKGSCMNTES